MVSKFHRIKKSTFDFYDLVPLSEIFDGGRTKGKLIFGIINILGEKNKALPTKFAS